MMIKLTNGAVQSLIKCLEAMKDKNVKLPTKIWYTLSWNRQQLNISARAAEDVRLQIINRIGVEGENGVKSVPQDKIAEFQKEYIELLDQETEVKMRKIPLSALEDASETMNGIDGIFDFFTYMVEEPDEEEVGTKAPLEVVEEKVEG